MGVHNATKRSVLQLATTLTHPSVELKLFENLCHRNFGAKLILALKNIGCSETYWYLICGDYIDCLCLINCLFLFQNFKVLLALIVAAMKITLMRIPKSLTYQIKD